MLEDYVLQLVHCNMYFGFADNKLKNRCLQLVTDYVLNNLGIKKLAGNEREWDLNKQTIKKYL